MSRPKLYKIITLLLVIFITGCKQEENPISSPELIDFSADFHRVWSKYDSSYPLFTYKNIDWIETYNTYVDEFYELSSVVERDQLLKEILTKFRDQHIYILSPHGIRYSTWVTPHLSNVNNSILDIYKNRMGWKQIDYFWGWGNIDNIGYIKIDGFDFASFDVNTYDDILDSLKYTNGLILDLRENKGGMLLTCLKILGRLINREEDLCYIISRNGTGYDDYTTPFKYTITPRGPWCYNNPIVALIGKTTVSVAEVFAEAINKIDHATLIGETTQGNVISPSKDTLNDGTIYIVPTIAFLKMNMQPFEGSGVAPHVHLEFNVTPGESLDPILEYSIDYIENRTYNKPLKTDRAQSSAVNRF